MRYDASGPFIRWVDYGYEGYKPESYDTLAEMLTTNCPYNFEITKKIEIKVEEGGEVKATWR